VKGLLQEIADMYSEPLRGHQLRDVARIAYNASLVLDRKTAGRICDIGGGVGMFTPLFARLGWDTVLVDDFSDQVNHELGDRALEPHRQLGLRVESRDAVAATISDLGRFDVVTSFDSMEHWHHSPRRLFASVSEALNPEGLFVLGVPNALNLRKRVTVPLGRGGWAPFDEWWEPEIFRGHVREPTVPDLYRIAREMRLDVLSVTGRNWLGYNSPHAWRRVATTLVDRIIRARSTLCSDIYLIAVKR
jgi:SAM-dependent methyltransferase